VRDAGHAGTTEAASAARMTTANANPNASGSLGLTLYSRYPNKRVTLTATTRPTTMPTPVKTTDRDITRPSKSAVFAPSAIRSASSRGASVHVAGSDFQACPFNPRAPRSRLQSRTGCSRLKMVGKAGFEPA
jgi:hypothetical protein